MRKSFVLSTAFATLLIAFTTQALAGDWKDYSKEGFSRAQASGSLLLVDVYADWCPTCKAQKPILDRIAQAPSLQGVELIRVDFDQHKDFVKEHRIPRQSTILLFSGNQELVRSIAETDEGRLRELILEGVRRADVVQ